jgi:2-keto-4-pentenoate hydratase/2-oxohepta-3-ene-1,7-dioic acid hydratase in catechol pathway
MKLATIDDSADGHVGVLIGDGEILDLVALREIVPRAHLVPKSLRGVLEAGEDGFELIRRCIGDAEGASAGERERLAETGALGALSATPLLAVIPDPRLILSVGLNYGRHLEEMSGTPRPQHPTAFLKVASSLTGSGKPIVVPPQCPDMIDFEGEFCFVFGRACHDVSVDEAMGYVAGYTIANDVSARDWIVEFFGAEAKFDTIHAWERNIMGKQLPGFTPCGPVMTTTDEIADPHDLQLTTRLNGEVMQSTRTDDLIYKLPEMISYFSKWYRFQPGDFVTTGSPAGVGFGRDPKVFMKPGDVVEIEIEGIGTLTNPLVAGA